MAKQMYLVVAYDISDPKKLPKMLKLCRKYFHWVQKSVFEGELSTPQYYKFKKEAGRIINRNADSLICYKMRTPSVVDKEVIGCEKNEITQFL